MKHLWKRSLSLVLALVMLAFCLSGCGPKQPAAESTPAGSGGAAASGSPLTGAPDETYYMVVFSTGAEFWKACYIGFQDAAKMFGVQTALDGPAEYDINKSVSVFDQVAAQNPAGIALCPINPDAFTDSINKAVADGQKVVTFTSDSPDSNRLQYISLDDVQAGRDLADAVAEAIGGKGEVGFLLRPGQLNLEQRYQGFSERLAQAHPDIKIVNTSNAEGDEIKAAQVTGAAIQANPDIKAYVALSSLEAIGCSNAVKESGKDIKVFTFDAVPSVLDMVKSGQVYATMALDAYSLGYWSMVSLYMARHELVNPISDWKETGRSPLPPFIDTGVTVVTAENADAYYDTVR